MKKEISEIEEYKKYLKELKSDREWKENNQERIEKIINYLEWEMYNHPRDENERWYNRGIIQAINTIETNFI